MSGFSFEEQLKKHERDKLAKGKFDDLDGVPLGTQLEYYAHPDHYQGCNFNTISRMVYIKQNVEVGDEDKKLTSSHDNLLENRENAAARRGVSKSKVSVPELIPTRSKNAQQRPKEMSSTNRRNENGLVLHRSKSKSREFEEEKQTHGSTFSGEKSTGVALNSEGPLGLGEIKSTTFGPGDNFGKNDRIRNLNNYRSKSFGNKRELLRNKYNFSQPERFPKAKDTKVSKENVDIKHPSSSVFPLVTPEDGKVRVAPENFRYAPGFESDSSLPRSPSRRISRRNRKRKTQTNSPSLELPSDVNLEENPAQPDKENKGGGRLSKGRSLFRRTIRIILHLQQWISAIMEKGEEESQGAEKTSSFSDFAQALSSQRMANSDVHFDPADFKAKKDINISKDVQYILNLPKAMRTPDQVQSVLYGLQHLRSFAEYPLHMQEKLCKVAFFQTVTPKRVIIRQGHYAENFYFILSGHAMVTLLERDAITGETQLRAVKTLKKGQSFGVRTMKY
ncbi:uncharacterized protein LOC106163212 [Lingula anatina]|uniref:Uncharacterized protein LOC106163212 n=1 Tax=Lingula anatina TaxID=7574 RepID=A0A1S3IDE8_LINAN|nr:uncharacterized protein LOC106163212 [Lingula anatina]|eukprot:XP_013396183.1 uncharacterized protein LOC106163212 [Lingula anatina]